MPYIRRGGSTSISVGGSQATNLIIGAGDSTTSLGAITTPYYTGVLSFATLDMSIAQMHSAAGVTNYFDGLRWIQIQDSGGTWRNACPVFDQFIMLTAGERINGQITIKGQTDIKAYLKPSTVYNVRWYLHNAQNDFLYPEGVMVKLNLYFN
jgi:hypothetical protein